MQRQSESIASLAAALAKAQIELQNPEKSLIGSIEAKDRNAPERLFRYASLASHPDRSLGEKLMMARAACFHFRPARLGLLDDLDAFGGCGSQRTLIGGPRLLGGSDVLRESEQNQAPQENQTTHNSPPSFISANSNLSAGLD